MLAMVAAALVLVQDAESRLVHEETNGGADSAVSPDGKWIAFSSRRTGNLDVWAVEVETGKTRQLTRNPANDYEPRWHPDGTKIVFTSERGGNQDVYFLDFATGDETQVTDSKYNEDYPSFSQDGKKVVFTGGAWLAREVHVKDLETGEARKITDGHRLVGAASFSADGASIVYHVYYESYESGKSDVFLVPAGGGEQKKVTDDRDIWDYKPVFSFDGKWIAFSSKRTTRNFNVWLMRPDGGGLRAITSVEGPDLRWPNWTRDGRLAWHRIDPQMGKIRAVELESGRVSDVAQSDSFVKSLIPSPDGTRFVYESAARIFVMDAAPGAKPRHLANGLEPRWSSDGKSVSFLRNRGTRVAIVPAEGGDPVHLDERPAQWPAAEPSGWSPDGKTLAVVVTSQGKEDIVLLSKDGTKRRLTEDGAKKSGAVWSPDGKRILYCENRPLTVGYYLTAKPVIGP